MLLESLYPIITFRFGLVFDSGAAKLFCTLSFTCHYGSGSRLTNRNITLVLGYTARCRKEPRICSFLLSHRTKNERAEKVKSLSGGHCDFYYILNH